MPICVLANFIKKFILVLWNQEQNYRNLHSSNRIPCFNVRSSVGWSSITGIIKKLLYDGYNFLSDPEIIPIFSWLNINGNHISLVKSVINDVGDINWSPENHYRYTSRIQENVKVFLLTINCYKKKQITNSILLPEYVIFQIIRLFVS